MGPQIRDFSEGFVIAGGPNVRHELNGITARTLSTREMRLVPWPLSRDSARLPDALPARPWFV